jgi:hypothetical protein
MYALVVAKVPWFLLVDGRVVPALALKLIAYFLGADSKNTSGAKAPGFMRLLRHD